MAGYAGPNMNASLQKKFSNHPLTNKEKKDYVHALFFLEEDFNIELISGATHTPAKKRFTIDLLKSAYLDHGVVDYYLIKTYEEILKLENEGKELEEFHKELMKKKAWLEDYKMWKKNKTAQK